MDENLKESNVPKKIPKLEYKKSKKSEIVLSIILIVVYCSDFIIGQILSNLSTTFIRIFVVTYYISLYVLAIFSLKSVIKEDIKLFKNNFKPYMKFIMAMYIIMKIVVVAILLIKTVIIGNGTSTNQQAINQLPIALTFVLAVIWAPLVEETIFRVSLRRFIKNDKIFVIISAIIFGGIHVLSEPSIVDALTNSIPYVLMGGCLAYTYKKTNNELCSILVHGVYNLIDVCLMMLLL